MQLCHNDIKALEKRTTAEGAKVKDLAQGFEKVKKAIQNISKKHNISENVIKTIIAYEYENTFSK